MFSFKASGEELPRNNSDDTVADNVEAPTKVNNKHRKIRFIIIINYQVYDNLSWTLQQEVIRYE